jgi:chemotaxis protein methyltransferase CheR
MSLAPQDMEFIRNLVLARSAIALEDNQHYLVEARLLPLAREAGHPDVPALLSQLRLRPFSEQHRRVVEAMTTNETSFFRDVHPWEALRRKIIPGIIDRRAGEKRLNIWCAASSSGQEPYSTMMLLRDDFPQLASWNLRFMCSDFSEAMVARGRAGKFNQLEMGRGLPALALVKHFERVGTEFQVKAHLRTGFEWFQMNLAGPWPPMPTMDLIFIRNVLIYFKPEIRAQILEKARKLLMPHGALMLGTTESPHGLCPGLITESFGATNYYRTTGKP